MKALIWVVLILAILGGGGFGLYKAGKLPFLPAPKAAKKAVAAKKADAGSVAAAPATPRLPARVPARTTRQDPADEAKAEKRISRLVALYEGMKADDAKPIIEKLPDPLVAEMLKRMDEGKAAKIMLGMKPERAAKLTGILAKEPAATVATSRQ